MQKIIFDFSNKTAIVTGGAQGFGLDIAKRFLNSGAKVIIWDVDTEILEKAKKELNNPNLSSNVVDVSQYEDVENCVNEIIKDNKIDILINNAGVIKDRSFTKMSKEEWDTVIDINLNGIFLVTKAVFPIMKKARYGRIISASSINGFAGAFGQANYAATKAGIVGFTKALSKEGGKYGITVNSIAPGHIETDMTNKMPSFGNG